MKLLKGLAAAAAIVFGFGIAADTAQAITTDPIVTVSAPQAVQAGTPITFNVAVNQTGYTPTCKITYTNPRTHSTINVANDGAINTADPFVKVYTPSSGEVGRLEVATCSVAVQASGHLVRLVSGYAYFGIQSDPVAAPLQANYLSTCSYHPVPSLLYGYATCATYGAPGGLNQVRVWVRCADGIGHVQDVYGAWVTGPGTYSYAHCSSVTGFTPDRMPTGGYQTR